MTRTPWPRQVRLTSRKDTLRLVFDDGEPIDLSAEFLRVHSPSAEVKGHGGQGGILPVGKQDVTITSLDPVGTYALRITFSDGHNTGLYSWDYLSDLARTRDEKWADYLQKSERT